MGRGAGGGVAQMVRLLQKIWYSDGSVRLQAFEASSAEVAMSQAYEALDGEIARQWEEGQVTVVKALCDEREVVELAV
jgi:hypothetical protein